MTDKSDSARSQCNKVLNYMRSNVTGITSMDAFRRFGITRLSGRIFDLREQGYDIQTITEKKKNEEGNTVQYARYVLR